MLTKGQEGTLKISEKELKSGLGMKMRIRIVIPGGLQKNMIENIPRAITFNFQKKIQESIIKEIQLSHKKFKKSRMVMKENKKTKIIEGIIHKIFQQAVI